METPLHTIRQTSGLNPTEMVAQVTGIRMTREGHLLVELAKGVKSVEAAKKLSSVIAKNLGNAVGTVSQSGQLSKVEIIDLDAITSEREVLKVAISGFNNDQHTISEREAIQITVL